jgi:L-ascorbate metabolism protein UlaG (beta-lactamase superfamily)
MPTAGRDLAVDPIILDAPPVRSGAAPTAVDALTWIGNATVLLRLGGFTILTDPNFLHAGDHVALGGGLRARRRKAPALTVEELPPLDLIVLSHHHGDHIDRVAIDALDKDLPIVTTGHAARKLEREGFRRTLGLRTWQTVAFRRADHELRVTSLPAQHGPSPVAAVLPETMGSLIEVASEGDEPGYRLYQTGDTLAVDALRRIADRFPDIDCALVHLGATRVLGLLLTADAEHGIEILRRTGPRHAVPIHIDDYTIQKMTLEDWHRAVAAAPDLPTQVHDPLRGVAVPLPDAPV